MGKMSRDKGSRYELKIAGIMSEWSGQNVQRVPRSGAAGSTNFKGDQRMSADIVFPIESNNVFIIELKNREEWRMEHFIYWADPMKGYWEQVVDDTRNVGDGHVPMLVFHKNRSKDYVVLPYQETLHNYLEANNMTCVMRKVWYEDSLEESHEFCVLLTTLPELQNVTFDLLCEWYAGVEWDKLNA